MTTTSLTQSPGSAPLLQRGRDFSVRDRVVVVTGAGQGIGREYVRQLAAAGAVPIVADINRDAADRVVGEIEAEGGQALAAGVDVSDPASVEALVQQTVSSFGRVDALVNNAAVFSTLEMRPFDEIPLEEWKRVLDVNVTGAFLCARAVTPHMRAAGWGRIVNIGSGSVPLGVPNYLHYVTSKAAMTGMTNSMAKELGRFGITVNLVQPGGTFHEVPRKTLTEEAKARQIAAQCINRGEIPADLSGLVIFLCTPAAEFITGQTLVCDGGLTHG
jgi:NAD(P)-dependent dehydrogenase (short-subunit alcohol dehydrogenase family)